MSWFANLDHKKFPIQAANIIEAWIDYWLSKHGRISYKDVKEAFAVSSENGAYSMILLYESINPSHSDGIYLTGTGNYRKKHHNKARKLIKYEPKP